MIIRYLLTLMLHHLCNTPLDQNLILKTHIITQDLQNFNPSMVSVNELVFLIEEKFSTLRNHQKRNRICLCFSTKHKPSIERLKRNMIYDHNREETSMFSFHDFLLRINNHFHVLRNKKSCPSKVFGNFHNITFLVHHRLYPLYFNSETSFFELERIPRNLNWWVFSSNWNWKISFGNIFCCCIISRTYKQKSIWSLENWNFGFKQFWRK